MTDKQCEAIQTRMMFLAAVIILAISIEGCHLRQTIKDSRLSITVYQPDHIVEANQMVNDEHKDTEE